MNDDDNSHRLVDRVFCSSAGVLWVNGNSHHIDGLPTTFENAYKLKQYCVDTPVWHVTCAWEGPKLRVWLHTPKHAIPSAEVVARGPLSEMVDLFLTYAQMGRKDEHRSGS